MEILHLDGMLGADGEAGTFEVSDSTVDIEEAFIHRCDLERLRELLAELLDEDREFLMTCFAYENDYIKRLSQKYGMTGSAV